MPKLTSISIKFLVPKDKPYEVSDIPGLFLRIHPSGKKVWKLNKSINKKRITKTLGEYPEVSIAEARAQVSAMSTNPFSQSNSTFRSIFNNWVEYKKTTTKYWKDIVSCMEKNVLPTLGSLEWNAITPMMYINTVKANVSEGVALDRYFRYIASIERFALTVGITANLKFQLLKSLLPKQESVHHVSIPALELPEFFKELYIYMHKPLRNQNHLPAIKMLFYTLLRANEAYCIKWSYIDTQNQVIVIPAERMKTRKEHTVPITTQIQSLLDSIPKKGEYVFNPKLNQYNMPKVMLNMVENVFKQVTVNGKRLVPHGIRAMGRTWMAEQGIDFEVAENCLAHTVGNQVVQAYNRTTLLERRRVAMQKWNDYVEECFSKSWAET